MLWLYDVVNNILRQLQLHERKADHEHEAALLWTGWSVNHVKLNMVSLKFV